MNWNIIGHEKAIAILQTQMTRGENHHAFLITGPKNIGRFTLAKRMAQLLNCLSRSESGEPCLNCLSCQKIEKLIHPDVMLLEAEESGGAIKVDQVRELLRFVSLAPYEGKYRVVILTNFEDATISAANALLKTLEEPPPNAVIILTSESVESMLSTIVSRCELIKLRPVNLQKLSKWLETEWNLNPEEAVNLAHICGGKPGLASQMMQDPGKLKQRITWIDDHKKLLTSNVLDKFIYLSPIFKESDSKETRENLKERLIVWISLWRDVILVSNGESGRVTNRDYIELLDDLASKFGSNKALNAVKSLERTIELIDRNVNIRLAAEVMMLDLPREVI